MSGKEKSGRYQSIDALRGLAALGVVFYHLSAHLKVELADVLPQFLLTCFSYGFLGVPIFFVISGFVISMSLRNAHITAGYAGRFMLRRSIRLDPTYWAAIFLALGLLLVKNEYLGGTEPMPSTGVILAHMFYLQDLLSVSPIISVVYWTLCLEVQLYLFYMLTLWVAQGVSQKLRMESASVANFLILAVGVYSLALDSKLMQLHVPGLFLSSWHYFLMGCLVSNVVAKERHSQLLLWAWLLIEVAFQLGVRTRAYGVAGVSVSVLIFAFWRLQLLESGLRHAALQFLGKISYTLYLIHPDVGWKAISVGKVVVEKMPFAGSALVLLVMGLVVSIVFAYIFHLAFERPSLILCAKIRKSPAPKLVSQPAS